MSLPCRDLRTEEAVGVSFRDRDVRTDGGKGAALCREDHLACPSDVPSVL